MLRSVCVLLDQYVCVQRIRMCVCRRSVCVCVHQVSCPFYNHHGWLGIKISMPFHSIPENRDVCVCSEYFRISLSACMFRRSVWVCVCSTCGWWWFRKLTWRDSCGWWRISSCWDVENCVWPSLTRRSICWRAPLPRAQSMVSDTSLGFGVCRLFCYVVLHTKYRAWSVQRLLGLGVETVMWSFTPQAHSMVSATSVGFGCGNRYVVLHTPSTQHDQWHLC